MYFESDDIVTNIGINVDAGDLDSVFRVCAPLLEELGIAAVEVSRRDLWGFPSGYIVEMTAVSRPSSRRIRTSLRHAARPVLARFGMSSECFELQQPETGPPWGSFVSTELMFDEFSLYHLTTVMGVSQGEGHRDRMDRLAEVRDRLSAWRMRKALSVPVPDAGIVARVHALVPTDDLSEALLMCLPLAKQMRAVAIDIIPAPREGGCAGYSAAILSALTHRGYHRDDEIAQDIRREAMQFIEAHGLDPSDFAVHETDDGLIGILEIDPAKLDRSERSPHVHGLYLRNEIDPFYDLPSLEDEGIEELIPDEPAIPFSEHELSEFLKFLWWQSRLQIGLVADVLGADAIDAREIARDLATRLRCAVPSVGGEVSAGEPELRPDGLIRVGCAIGDTDAEPDVVAAAVMAALDGGDWDDPQDAHSGEVTTARWQAVPVPHRGVARLELVIGKGSSLASLWDDDDVGDGS